MPEVVLMPATPPGRVYAARPNREYGELPPPRGCRVTDLDTGEPVRFVLRVEFDADADEGWATVTTADADAAGHVRYADGEVYKTEARRRVRVAGTPA